MGMGTFKFYECTHCSTLMKERKDKCPACKKKIDPYIHLLNVEEIDVWD